MREFHQDCPRCGAPSSGRSMGGGGIGGEINGGRGMGGGGRGMGGGGGGMGGGGGGGRGMGGGGGDRGMGGGSGGRGMGGGGGGRGMGGGGRGMGGGGGRGMGGGGRGMGQGGFGPAAGTTLASAPGMPGFGFDYPDRTAHRVEHIAQIRADIAAHQPGALTAEERADLLLMREEEKIARDVYLRLYEQWGIRPFDNIAGAE
ncbi:MAG: DUF2202 domain-containing protein, partial [Thiomonas sp.]|nr:DUF2202 domain-containing protein [Thiomonas sp.]